MCNQEGALMAFVACQVLKPASQWLGAAPDGGVGPTVSGSRLKRGPRLSLTEAARCAHSSGGAMADGKGDL